jgi:UDP-glucose 6-dehydrogenase
MMRALAVVKRLVTKGYTVDMLTLQTSATHVINEQEYDFLKDVHVVYANPNRTYNAIVSGANAGIKQKVYACYVVGAVKDVMKVCPKGATVVIESTVSPGTIGVCEPFCLKPSILTT